MIELAELKTLLRSIFGADISDGQVDKTFGEIDTDQSGTLDFLEVLTVRIHGTHAGYRAGRCSLVRGPCWLQAQTL